MAEAICDLTTVVAKRFLGSMYGVSDYQLNTAPFDAGLALRNDGSAGNAYLWLRRLDGAALTEKGDAPTSRCVAGVPLGHIDAAAQIWRVYTDFVTEGEVPRLTQAFMEMEAEERDRLRWAAGMRGERFIDLRHPATQEARSRVGQFLAQTGAAQNIIEMLGRSFDERGVHRSMDEMTTVFAIRGQQLFRICYQGLVLTDRGCRTRGEARLQVTPDENADRSGKVAKRVTPGDLRLRRLKRVSAMLLHHQNTRSDFSAKVCAIAYNVDN